MILSRGFTTIFAILLIVASTAGATSLTCSDLFYDRASLNPYLLKSQEAKLEKILGPNIQDLIARRGLTLENYYGPDLVRFMFGDWSKAIGSHEFTRKLHQKMSNGRPF